MGGGTGREIVVFINEHGNVLASASVFDGVNESGPHRLQAAAWTGAALDLQAEHCGLPMHEGLLTVIHGS